MRRLIFASLVASTLIFMSILSVPAVADTCCGLALNCTIELELNQNPEPGDPDWIGAVDGDVVGVYQLWEHWDEIFFTGPAEDPAVEHYFEDFVIANGDDRIEGIDQGIYNLGNSKFHYTGYVTAATGQWSYLVGWNIHGQGVVDIQISGEEVTVTGIGTMALVPP